MHAASLRNDSTFGALAQLSQTRATVRAVHDVFQAFEAQSRDGHPTTVRVGSAPLHGALGVAAYRVTATSLLTGVVGRIDEYV